MGQAVAITNRDHSAEALRRIAARHKDAEVVRRLLALALVLEGVSRTEAARRNGMDGRPCVVGCTATTRQVSLVLPPGWRPGPRRGWMRGKWRRWKRWCSKVP